MLGTKTFVSNIFFGQNRSFIYIWLSKAEKLVYVGQTNDTCGTWGRGFSHIQKSGTLRLRALERLGLNIDYISDFILYSYPLPILPEFTGIETSYRLAVEYLVQFKLAEERININPIFKIISNIATTDRTNNHLVQSLANEIVSDFIKSY